MIALPPTSGVRLTSPNTAKWVARGVIVIVVSGIPIIMITVVYVLVTLLGVLPKTNCHSAREDLRRLAGDLLKFGCGVYSDFYVLDDEKPGGED